MRKQNYNLEGLIQGIESFIANNRCSLTNEDLVLLIDCLKVLKDDAKTNWLSFEKISKILEFILMFLSTSDIILNLFH